MFYIFGMVVMLANKLACLTAAVWEVAECLIGDKNGFY